MTPARAVKGLIVMVVLATLAACGRGVAVESEPGPVYRVMVENPMPHAMVVQYDDGTEPRELGTVPARSTSDFIIAAPASRTVEISARDEARTHSVTRTVTLQVDRTERVTLTP